MAHYFDAAEYLRANPDVANAVGEGRVPSAWSHFVSHGYLENRGGVSAGVLAKVETVMGPVPRSPPRN
jgi:hypothetical protein